jgi:hypothetical protein
MSNRTTVIIGAGAVLDFDFEGITFPSTSNITNIVSKLIVQGLDSSQSNIIPTIFNELNSRVNEVYIRRGLPMLNYSVNFEELFFAIECLSSINNIYNNENLVPNASPLWGYLVEQISVRYPSIEYQRALIKIIYTIIGIIKEYDTKFCNDVRYETWYRNFWRDKLNKWDIFTFNYDTTVENSLKLYEDGFELADDTEREYEHFVPSKLYANNERHSTIHHLHGCIYYSELNPRQYEFEHSHRDMYKLHNPNDAILKIGIPSSPSTQAYERYVNSPIIIGQRKLDKQIYLPFSIYHANLANKILDNPNLLIVGYSFGDLYANQLIERHKLIHGDNQRIVLIDKFPTYIETKANLYRHIEDNLSGGLKMFLRRQFNYKLTPDFKIVGLDIAGYDSPIFSEDKRTLMFISGFKSAIKHRELIYNFLRL